MVSVNDPFPQIINTLFSQLGRAIDNVNRRGDLAGLASFHFLQNNQSSITWNVHVPTQEWLEYHKDEIDQAPQLATLGYLIFEEGNSNDNSLTEGKTEFSAHLRRLVERQNIFTTPNSWILQPTVVLGITLGVLACSNPTDKQWLQTKLREGMQRIDLSLYVRLLYRYGLFLIQPPSTQFPPFPFSSLDENTITLSERALAIWMTSREILIPSLRQKDSWLEDAQADLLKRCISEDLDSIGDEKAALLRQVLTTYINIRSRLPTLNLVQSLLTNFVPAMERWQPKWKIEDEYDIQALLWLILRAAFDEVRYEEYLPKRGRSGHRYDIGIPALGLLVEAKYIYESSEFQKIVEAIAKDSAQITSQKEFTGFFVFVYDASRSNQNHDWAIKEILNTERVRGCVIVSAPSQLSLTKKRIKRRTQSTSHSKKKV